MSNALTGQAATDRTTLAIRAALNGRSVRLRSALLFAGPAVIASVAYVDPGNIATNVAAGAGFGYVLLWVVLAANLIAMLFQGLSAKLGIVTGRNLAELCRAQFSGPVVLAMWGASEAAAMATDLGEFLGGAIGLALLLRLPLLAGMGITAAVTLALLYVARRGFRPMEIVIGALVGTIGLCYLVELFIAPVDWGSAALHTVLPVLPSAAALTIAVGIIGATVMPHAIFLHSGLTQNRVAPRSDAERRKLVRFSNNEVIIALTVAGLINMAIVVMAAAACRTGQPALAGIETAYRTLTPLLGIGAGAVFLVALTASGVSSSIVGTMAGQMIMQGFTGLNVPIWLRRLCTMVPAFIVVAAGANATEALIVSQVALSLVLPVPMIALVAFTRRRDIMGEYANTRLTDLAAIGGAAVVLSLNVVLIVHLLGIGIPGLPVAG